MEPIPPEHELVNSGKFQILARGGPRLLSAVVAVGVGLTAQAVSRI